MDFGRSGEFENAHLHTLDDSVLFSVSFNVAWNFSIVAYEKLQKYEMFNCGRERDEKRKSFLSLVILNF